MPKLTREQAEQIIQTVLDHHTKELDDGLVVLDDYEQTVADVQEVVEEPPTHPTDDWKHDDPPSFDRLAKPTMRKVKP